MYIYTGVYIKVKSIINTQHYQLVVLSGEDTFPTICPLYLSIYTIQLERYPLYYVRAVLFALTASIAARTIKTIVQTNSIIQPPTKAICTMPSVWDKATPKPNSTNATAAKLANSSKKLFCCIMINFNYSPTLRVVAHYNRYDLQVIA